MPFGSQEGWNELLHHFLYLTSLGPYVRPSFLEQRHRLLLRWQQQQLLCQELAAWQGVTVAPPPCIPPCRMGS